MYADHASTAIPTLFPAVGSWANPSADHAPGRAARSVVTAAVARIARCLGWDRTGGSAQPTDHVLVTSGATEGINLVVRQPSLWSFIVTSRTEHHAVLASCEDMLNNHRCEVVYLPPTATGEVDHNDVRTALEARRGRRGLVTVALVNNEVGVVQDIASIGRVVRDANGAQKLVWLHTDAVQAPGHVDPGVLDVGPGGQLQDVDFLTLSAHKFHGPTGVGILFSRTPPSAVPLEPAVLGGHQQGGMRAGTESVSLVQAAANALDDAIGDQARLTSRLSLYRDWTRTVWEDVLAPFVVAGLVLPTGPPPGPRRAPHHISFCVRGVHHREFLKQLGDAGVVASGGSACNSNTPLPSHVLTAIGTPVEFIHGSVRITLSHSNSAAEVVNVLVPVLRTVLMAVLQHQSSVSHP